MGIQIFVKQQQQLKKKTTDILWTNNVEMLPWKPC